MIPVTIAWFIWHARNKAKFEREIQKVDNIIFGVQEFIHLMGVAATFSLENCKGDEFVFLVQTFANKSPRIKAVIIHWNAPLLGSFKLNTNTSVNGDMAKVGGIVHDHCGRMVVAFHKQLGSYKVLEAESRH